MRRLLVVLGLIASTAIAGSTFLADRSWSATQRSSEVTRRFQAMNPCPANGNKTGPCPGYVKDHKWPLCAGGPDTVANLQWQTVAEARKKDVLEKQVCAANRRK